MTEKLDLPAIGKLYGYTPPEPEPLVALNIDWGDVSSIKDDWVVLVKKGELLRITVTKTFK